MKLDELLNKNHNNIGEKKSRTQISEVYGIIYRIYCIPENKSYIGQTFSHNFSEKYICKSGIITRIRDHYNNRILDSQKHKPLYITLSTYETNQFEIFEEEQLYGKDIGLINQKEGEYMEKYNSIYPHGYNIENIGKKYSNMLLKLSEHHDFEILKNVYEDTTRGRRVKDICVGTYFKLKKQSCISLEKTLELLKTVDVESVTLTDSKGFRLIVKIKGERDNIRIYFSGKREECVEYAKKISNNIIIKPSFKGKDVYKYQDKLDAMLEDKDIIESVTCKSYHNNARNCDTYLVSVYGNKNSRSQIIHKISFGGSSIKIDESYKIALDFIEKIKENIDNSSVKYSIHSPSL
jgi:hypothetical protein